MSCGHWLQFTLSKINRTNFNLTERLNIMLKSLFMDSLFPRILDGIMSQLENTSSKRNSSVRLKCPTTGNDKYILIGRNSKCNKCSYARLLRIRIEWSEWKHETNPCLIVRKIRCQHRWECFWLREVHTTAYWKQTKFQAKYIELLQLGLDIDKYTVWVNFRFT